PAISPADAGADAKMVGLDEGSREEGSPRDRGTSAREHGRQRGQRQEGQRQRRPVRGDQGHRDRVLGGSGEGSPGGADGRDGMRGARAGRPGGSSPDPEDVALDDRFFRRESGRLLAALTRIFGVQNIALAEDVVQDTLAHAFEVWSFSGIPAHYS